MMKTIITLCISIFSIFFVSCSNFNENTLKKEIVGTYSALLQDGTYSEVVIYSDSILFRTERDGYYGPFFFKLENTKMYYNTVSPKVIKINCHIYELEFDTTKLVLEKITTIDAGNDYSNIDPFYLRRCNYLVAKGKITFEQAQNYLCDIEIANDVPEKKIR